MLNGSKLYIPPTNYHLLAARQEPYQKTKQNKKPNSAKKVWGNALENSQTFLTKSYVVCFFQQKNDEARELSRKIRETGKGNQTTALGSRQEVEIRHHHPPFRNSGEKECSQENLKFSSRLLPLPVANFNQCQEKAIWSRYFAGFILLYRAEPSPPPQTCLHSNTDKNTLKFVSSILRKVSVS